MVQWRVHVAPSSLTVMPTAVVVGVVVTVVSLLARNSHAIVSYQWLRHCLRVQQRPYSRNFGKGSNLVIW